MKNLDVFGGSLIKKIIENINVDVAGDCLWIHPLTFNNKSIDELSSVKKFIRFLENSNSEYLLIELSSVRQMLFEASNGAIYRLEDVRRYEKENNTIIDGVPLSPLQCNNWEESICMIANLIKKRYTSLNIIIISAKTQSVVNNGDYYIESGTYWSEVQELIKKCEITLCEELSCHYINITQYYVPMNHTDSFVFPRYYYSEINERLDRVLNTSVQIIDSAPNFEHRYLIAAEAFSSLNSKLLFKLILDLDNPLETCISQSKSSFVKKYVKELVLIRKMGHKTIKELVAYCNEKETPFFKRLLFIGKILSDIELSESEVFFIEEKFVINQLLIKYTRDFIASVYSEYPSKMICQQNLFAFYKLVKGKNIDSQEISMLIDCIKKPYLIDVWGSCISRFIFNYADEVSNNNFVVDKYVLHGNPLNFCPQKILYDTSKLNKEIYAEKILKWQLDGSNAIREYYQNPVSPYLVCDLYSLYAENVFLFDETYVLTGLNLGNRIFPNRKSEPIYKSLSIDQIKEKLLPFLDFIQKEYGERVILISSKNVNHYLSNEKILEFECASRINDINCFISEIEEWFVSKINCFYIDINQFFLSDKNQISGMSPYHYERQLYIDEYNLISQIYEGLYTGAKHIRKINPEFLLRRFLILRKDNRKILELFAYRSNDIWRYLFNLEDSYIDVHFEDISALIDYASNCREIEDVRILNLTSKERKCLEEIIREGRTNEYN